MVTYLPCDQMIEMIGRLDENSTMALDTEGTNIELDYRDGRGFGTGISIAIRYGGLFAGYYPYRHPKDNIERDEQHRLNTAICQYKGWLAMHNSKHDLVALKTLGVDYKGKFYDTMIMAHLINETFPYVKSLNGCSDHYLGEGFQKDDALVKNYVAALQGQWHLVPAEVMAPYAQHDAVLTLQLCEKIEPLLFKEIPREYWDHKQKFIRTLITMEGRGIAVDVDLCNRMLEIGHSQMDEAKELLGYNLASHKDQYQLFIEDLKLPILKVGKSGKPSFDKSVMVEYERILEGRKNDTTAALVLSYRGWAKATSSNYKPYVALLSPDGRLRCNYKMHSTKTGRLSCEKPNLQQIPKVSDKAWNGSMKACFIAAPGYTLVSFDYSQLELRIAAAYGRQENLLDIFKDPTRDVFTEMSKELGFNRFDTKTLTYSIQFGAGALRISNVFGVSLTKGGEIRDHFWSTYPGIKQVSDKAAGVCRTKGKVQLWSGRYRHFMFPSEDAHKSFNSVCQGGAADIMNSVMVRLFEEIDSDTCRMLLQIHDEIVWEIKTELLDEYMPKIQEIMEDVAEFADFGVPFAVHAKVWGED